jgi:hypothetical protein
MSLSALISAQNTQRKNEHHVEFLNVKPVVRKKPLGFKRLTL